MQENLEDILNLPTRTKFLILLGAMLLIAGAYYYFFYSSIRTELLVLETAIDGPKGLRTQIAQKEGIARNLEKFRSEVAKLNTELTKALRELPDSREIAQLLLRISDKARDSGLQIRLFKPQPEQKRDFYAEVPVEIEVFGTFHQVAAFFDEVGHLERIVNLDQFNLTDPEVGEDRVGLKTSVVATSFRFLDEKERPQAEKETVDAKKRRRNK